MKTNIPPFQIGDKVVYITGISMPKDSIHIVTGLHQEACGCWYIAIDNLPFWTEDSTYMKDVDIVICPDCKKEFEIQLYVNICGWDPESFRLVQEQKAKLLTFEKIQQEEKEEILTMN